MNPGGDLLQQLLTLFVGVGAAGGGGFAARFMHRLLKDRDAALDAAAAAQTARQVDAQSLAKVNAELAAANAELAAQAREMRHREKEFESTQRKVTRLYPETKRFLDTDVMPLDESKQ